jgi:putative oxidoreductase
MFTAIRKVHLDKGFSNTGGGYEFNATLIAATTALVESGPGSPSVDRAIGLRTSGSRWALASLAAAAAGSAAAISSGARAGQDEAEIPRTGRFTREPQQAEQTVNA